MVRNISAGTGPPHPTRAKDAVIHDRFMLFIISSPEKQRVWADLAVLSTGPDAYGNTRAAPIASPIAHAPSFGYPRFNRKR